MPGRPRDSVVLTDEERAVLRAWTRSRTTAQARALRARIVLACETEPTSTAVARLLGVSRDMVTTWRSRFLADRLAGLGERPRPGRPPAADDDAVAHVLVRTLTPAPDGSRRGWSTRAMAAETGLSQSTVSRIWRTHHLSSPPGARRPWSLPARADEPVGLFVAPPVCVLAVTSRKGAGTTAATRLLGDDAEAAHVLGVACAFATLRGTPGDHTDALAAFVARTRATVTPTTTVHYLAHGVPAHPHNTPGWHHAPTPEAWTAETRRLLTPARLPHDPAPAPTRLRDALLTWSTGWTPAAGPFTEVVAPRASYATPAICGPDSDSKAVEQRAANRPPTAPTVTDPVVDLLRDAVLTGGHRSGDRVREAPLATRLGLSRRVVRAGLRALVDEGMLDPLPGGGTGVPVITAKDVLDLYALRAGLGALLLRRVAMLGRANLAPASAVLAEVRAAARDNDHLRIREVDLRYQDALARAADLPQAAGTFERLTARLRVFVNVLDMNYGQACDTIASEDTAVHTALCDADGNEAARLWRVKIERCVRYMIAELPQDDVAPYLWTTLAGRPRMRAGEGAVR
ncbi:helix-turn-helix domain-containing protein [Streptomyces sp. NPDC004539]|uniref:helix-turn-helix domain-containing protein n=1 Tax=Streptomyces sp. NPDC004539 TaxID=3154280 RepID=UPI0033BB9154